MNDVMSKANEELIEIARRSEPSVLRKRTYEGMSNENWMIEVMNELSTRCPVVSDILSKLLDIMSSTIPVDKNRFHARRVDLARRVDAAWIWCYKSTRVLHVPSPRDHAHTNKKHEVT